MVGSALPRLWRQLAARVRNARRCTRGRREAQRVPEGRHRTSLPEVLEEGGAAVTLERVLAIIGGWFVLSCASAVIWALVMRGLRR
jgi:hypothetical protein